MGRDVAVRISGRPDFVTDVGRQFDPYEVSVDDERTALLEIREADGRLPHHAELLNRAGDGWITAHDVSVTYAVAGRSWCAVPLDTDAIIVSRSFPRRRLARIIRTSLQLRLLQQRSTPVLHASAAVIDGRAVVISGWSESGKSETALALMERGARFLSDKWTMLSPGGAAAFPIGIGVRDWALAYLPTLRRALPSAARLRLTAAHITRVTTRPLRDRAGASGRIGLLGEIAQRGVELGSRAALTPTQLRRCYADLGPPVLFAPLSLVVVLRNAPSDSVAVGELAVDEAAARMAVSAANERRDFAALHQRAAFANSRVDSWTEVVEADRLALHAAFTPVRVLQVAAPFPGDPRVVASAILDHL